MPRFFCFDKSEDAFVFEILRCSLFLRLCLLSCLLNVLGRYVCMQVAFLLATVCSIIVIRVFFFLRKKRFLAIAGSFQEHMLISKFMLNGFGDAAFLAVFLCTVPLAAYGVSVSCMMAYEKGGAPAVFNSPECPQWDLPVKSSQNSTMKCQFATLQGLRNLADKNGLEEVSVGVAAIFDGHGGEEASEMASRKLLDYLFMHVVFIEYKRALPIYKNEEKLFVLDNEVKSSHQISPKVDHRSILHEVLGEALLRTIKDIDSEFSVDALDKGYTSGCTGLVVILVDGELLIANIGDSKALLCSVQKQSRHDSGRDSVTELFVEELTRDHHPDREDEKARIEAAGGTVSWWGVPRVNGVLAISRAIGDVFLKRYGVIAEPEVSGWRRFTPENRYLVMASDGIFEVFTPQNVCDLLYEKASELNTSSLLADWIVQSAFKAGSQDNLSTVLINLFDDTNK